MSYPLTALEAKQQLEALPHDYLKLSIERSSSGYDYLMGETDQGWTIVWSPEE